jgi:hypothetical protein
MSRTPHVQSLYVPPKRRAQDIWSRFCQTSLDGRSHAWRESPYRPGGRPTWFVARTPASDTDGKWPRAPRRGRAPSVRAGRTGTGPRGRRRRPRGWRAHAHHRREFRRPGRQGSGHQDPFDLGLRACSARRDAHHPTTTLLAGERDGGQPGLGTGPGQHRCGRAASRPGALGAGAAERADSGLRDRADTPGPRRRRRAHLRRRSAAAGLCPVPTVQRSTAGIGPQWGTRPGRRRPARRR